MNVDLHALRVKNKNKNLICNLAHSPGVNTPVMADFKLPV